MVRVGMGGGMSGGMEQRPTRLWRWRQGELALGAKTRVMGVVNVTPDSFSDGGECLRPEAAVERALGMLDAGAEIVDIGAESTRPGSRAGADDATVTAEEEQRRLLPVIEAIARQRPEAVISVDTYKAATARAALEAGAQIVNDVSGFGWDREMAGVCAEAGCGVVLMHTRGRPQEWAGQSRLAGEAVLAMVRDGLAEQLAAARAAGVREEAIVLDPGYGFGKRQEENYSLLARQRELLALGRPLLVGVSRKSFLRWALEQRGTAGGRDEDEGLAVRETSSVGAGEAESEAASVAAMVAGILAGASVVRVHDVKAAVRAAAVADAVFSGG